MRRSDKKYEKDPKHLVIKHFNASMANSVSATKMVSYEGTETVSIPFINAKITSEPSKRKKRQREHFCGVEMAITKLLW